MGADVSGMTQNLPLPTGAVFQFIDWRGDVGATHAVPLEGFVHEVDEHGGCLCGPWRVNVVNASGAVVPMFTHARLEDPALGHGGGGFDDDDDDEPLGGPDGGPDGSVELDLPVYDDLGLP